MLNNKDILLQNMCKPRGYVALIATTIIGFVLLVVTTEAGLYAGTIRFTILGSESKEQSKVLAEGCLERALAHVITDIGYPGDATSTEIAGQCYVFPVLVDAPTVGLVTLRVRAIVQNSYTTIEATYQLLDINIKPTPLDYNEIIPRLTDSHVQKKTRREL